MNFLSGSVYPAETFIKARLNGIPLFATFELTPRCNFNCGMCYVHLKNSEIEKYGKELTAEEWISIGQQAAKQGTLFLTITGGEPSLHPDFCEIYSQLCKMGFIITLQSNLYSFSDECLDLIMRYPPQKIKFTIYGASNETYKKVCGVNDGFTKVNENIKKLKASGIALRAVTTVTKDNYGDLQAISDLMNEYNISWVNSSALKKSGRGIENEAEELRITDDMYPDFCIDVKNSMEKAKNRHASKPCEVCREYRSGFIVKWNGKMGFCSFLNEPDIDVVKSGFCEAWKELINFEDTLQWPEKCRNCEISDICPRCAALIATESGSLHTVNEDYCKYIKNLSQIIDGGK